jgi:hypothetical protein
VQGGAANLAMQLDGAVVGVAGKSIMWEPKVGAHRLALVDPTGAVVDQILFTVR